MRAVRTEQSNFTYTGFSAEIADLPCRREDGRVYAVFTLSEEERAQIAAGCQIELMVGTYQFPPVAVKIVNEPEKPGPDDTRCERCGALYVRQRGMKSCGWCGGELVDAAPGGGGGVGGV